MTPPPPSAFTTTARCDVFGNPDTSGRRNSSGGGFPVTDEIPIGTFQTPTSRRRLPQWRPADLHSGNWTHPTMYGDKKASASGRGGARDRPTGKSAPSPKCIPYVLTAAGSIDRWKRMRRAAIPPHTLKYIDPISVACGHNRHSIGLLRDASAVDLRPGTCDIWRVCEYIGKACPYAARL